MILPRNVLVLVVDGARMLLLRNDGDADDPQLTVIVHRERPSPPNRDLFADAAGRVFSSAAPFRSAHDNGDPHDAQERAFVASALVALAERVDDDGPGFIIAADPVSLGRLRADYPARIASGLIAELDKDLTGMPVDAICRRLRAS